MTALAHGLLGSTESGVPKCAKSGGLKHAKNGGPECAKSGGLHIQSEHTVKTDSQNNVAGTSPDDTGKDPGVSEGTEEEIMKLKDLIGASPESLGKAAVPVADVCNKTGKLWNKLHHPDKALAAVFAWKQGVSNITGGFVH